MTESVERATWLTPHDRDMMRSWLTEDVVLQSNISLIQGAALNVEQDISTFFSVFMGFKGFWREDLHAEYRDFMETNSCIEDCSRKVRRHITTFQHL